MGERRALLDPEMYKISEEDSQDEEVLASYTEDALKLGGVSGGGGPDDVSNGNFGDGVAGGRHSRSSWNTRRDQHHDVDVDFWNYTGSSSSQFNPSKLRFVQQQQHGLSSNKYNYHGKTSIVSGGVRVVTNNSTGKSIDENQHSRSRHHSHDYDNNVDWPESSTNSDSYVSGDERRGDRSAISNNTASNPAATKSTFNAIDNEKFLSKTYFGDHIRHRRGVGEGAENDGESRSYPHPSQNASASSTQQQQAQSENNHSRPKQFQKRSSRRPRHGSRNVNESTSGSDCSDDGDGSSSSCGSDCEDYIRSTSGNGGEHHRHHHHHGRGGRRHVNSSSEVEEYDSSYSDDSSYDDKDGERDDDEYNDYYDEDEENECFDDIVKFLSDGEVESSTNADGDLFLVEYSGDEESDGPVLEPRTFPRSSRRSLEGSAGAETLSETRRDSQEEQSVDSVQAATSSTSATTGGGHFRKSPSTGKGAKGRISRLLKRKQRDTTTKTSQSEASSTAQTPLASNTASTSLTLTVPESATQLPATSMPTSSGNTPPQSQSASLSSTGSGKKQKGNTAATVSAPEKVFRFKDEHGGETRTVFVDIPQSARTGNLLGRRATLIESILGIIPGHFSTPSAGLDRIMVAGFVPDGVASRYRRIKIGDWLQSVDDIPVDHVNVDQVLNSRSMYGKRRTAFETEYLRLKLTLRRVAGCMVSLPQDSACGSSPQGGRDSPEVTPLRYSCTSITEPCWSMVSPQVQSNVAILFISSSSGSTNCANSENSNSEGNREGAAKEKSKDVVYCWPRETESKMVKALAASQGMFSTLYRLLWDVTGSHPLVSKVVIDDCEMDVTYTSDDHGKSLLLVAIATSLSTFTIHHIQHQGSQKGGKGGRTSGASFSQQGGGGSGSASGATASGGETKKKEKKIRWREPQAGGATVSTRVLTRLENLLKYQFGSLARAFKDGNVEKVSRLLTNSLSALNDLSEDYLFLQVPGNFLRFPNCIRSGIDDVLYSFETSESLNNSANTNRNSTFSSSSSTSSRRRSKDLHSLPVFHCHGSCLMYKGFLITSHLENDLASSFHGWWRTQLGLWEGIKRNALLERWKPVSRLALWQETCIPNKTTAVAPPPKSVNPTLTNEEGDDVTLSSRPSVVAVPKSVRCFSGLVGIGNFTLGFVLEHLTDYHGSVGPDADWLRRAMATICRLYQSGLSRSFECWLEEKQGGREEYLELCGASSSLSSNTSKRSSSSNAIINQQERIGSSSLVNSTSFNKSSTLTKKVPATGSILKNTETSLNSLPNFSCSIHSPGTAVINSTTAPLAGGACTCSSPQSVNSSSPIMKNFMISSSSTSSSSSSTFSSGGIRSGITGGTDPNSVDDMPRVINGEHQYDSDAGEEQDADDTTTGTGSDNSSFKWYERAGSESSGFAGTNQSFGNEVKHIRVTRGNVLFDYMQVEFGRGVMLSSKDIHEGWAATVRHNFRQSCTVIHSILHKAANARQRLEERGQDKKWVSLALAPISEHGILFNCQITDPRDLHKKKPRKRDICYWVVGRIYPDEREIYVCYEDGPLSQNIVEIAYKIALNVHC